ncbi:hypothetical protein DFP72DRAFT_393753 [Ephemerocybe angulata]|uniref:Uncharacterized protein n=1 Tax=Ephemerocybe angulata TaxID=980116 RepID=A0A8H6HV57_9AGAR|nr:hypothetical protein DFP72DRAFT_393753 [Tulosesus angulatus]
MICELRFPPCHLQRQDELHGNLHDTRSMRSLRVNENTQNDESIYAPSSADSSYLAYSSPVPSASACTTGTLDRGMKFSLVRRSRGGSVTLRSKVPAVVAFPCPVLCSSIRHVSAIDTTICRHRSSCPFDSHLLHSIVSPSNPMAAIAVA